MYKSKLHAQKEPVWYLSALQSQTENKQLTQNQTHLWWYIYDTSVFKHKYVKEWLLFQALLENL